MVLADERDCCLGIRHAARDRHVVQVNRKKGSTTTAFIVNAMHYSSFHLHESKTSHRSA
jgi:hypothetical protein